MPPYMPVHLAREILLRLPVKSLLRFRAIGKSWSRLISSKPFINDHLAISKDNDLCLLRYRNGNQPEYLLCPDDRFLASWHSAEKLVAPFSDTGFSCLDVGYCNGIICLLFCRPVEYGNLKNPDHYAMLWNPSIRKHLIAQTPYLRPWNWSGAGGHNFGFGFDSVSGVYKLVNMRYFCGEIYPEEWSLRDGKWKTSHGKASLVLEKFERPFRRSVFLNGKSHWLVTKSYPHISGVVSYDLHSQTLNKILVPNGLMQCRDSSLHVFKDRLSLCIDTRNYTKDYISLWIMKEYGTPGSWVKIFESRNLTSVDKVIGLRSRGEVVYCRRNGELISYGPLTQRIHNSGVKVGREPPFYFNREVSFYLDRYRETLSLLDEADMADYEDPVAEEFR